MPSASTATLTSDLLLAEISTLGAELQSVRTKDGRDLLWSGDPAVWSGRSPILFPVIGLLENGQYHLDGKSFTMPKHGFARHSEFEIEKKTANSAGFRLQASTETRAMYPFDFQLDINFELDASTLTLGAVISNHGDVPMPASFGFHPAWRWPLPFGQPRSDHRILFAQDESAPIRRIDAEGFLKPNPVPTPVVGNVLALQDDLFIDDALIFDRLASREVWYGAPVGPQLHGRFEDFPTLGVWTKPGAEFVCIEGWSGFSDPEGFTGDIRDKPGIFEISPGGAKTMSMSISLEDAASF